MTPGTFAYSNPLSFFFLRKILFDVENTAELKSSSNEYLKNILSDAWETNFNIRIPDATIYSAAVGLLSLSESLTHNFLYFIISKNWNILRKSIFTFNIDDILLI